MPTVSLVANNKIWLTYRHFPYKAWHAIAELVDNSTQSYFENRDELDPVLKEEGREFEVRIDYDPNKLLSVWDNAMGMDLEDLDRAVQLATPPPNTAGRSEFGMGMKTSCCWLGSTWTIVTKKLGNNTEYTLEIDVNKIAASDTHELEVTEKHVSNASEHYTRIEITGLYRRLHGNALNIAKANLVEMYRPDILGGVMTLRWKGEALVPPDILPLVTDTGGVTREWKKDIEFDVEGLKVRGWICILADRGRSKAGFDLYRRGRVIIGRPLGYRPLKIFGEARNDLINQRVYGQLELDQFPVNHLKDDILWDGREDEFQDKLKAEAADFIDFARNYRPTKEGGPGPAVVETTNDQLADEFANMLGALQIAEITGPAPLDDTVREAKAEKLRSQPIAPRIINVGPYVFRLYHPEGMPESDLYFFRQSAKTGEIDVFINDNHPFAAAVEDEASYAMFARMCCLDAMTEYFLVHFKGEITPTYPAELKDRLLRGFRDEDG